MPRPRPRRRHAFTLVELLMAMGVAAVLLGMVVSRIDRERFRVDAQVQALGLRMNRAQRDAVLRQHDVVLVFDVGAGIVRLQVDANNDGQLGFSETEAVLTLEDGVRFGLVGADALPWGAEPVTFPVGPTGLPTLRFHRNGSASAFGAVYLSSRAGSVEHNRAIEVERATGEVRCHTYRTGAWVLSC
jgi:prepilin-type N-terminal cleavage/methylation domain-containing protein